MARLRERVGPGSLAACGAELQTQRTQVSAAHRGPLQQVGRSLAAAACLADVSCSSAQRQWAAACPGASD